MNLLLLVLRLLLDLLFPSGRNGVSLAARADGRVEQVPAERAVGPWQLGRSRAAARRGSPAPKMRATGEADAEAPPG
jgi:hypothetical protein